MRYYTKILIWENNRRLNKLIEFQNLVVEYFNNSGARGMGEGRIETEVSQVARVKINRAMKEVHAIILQSETIPVMNWTPPPVVGGRAADVDLIQNIFNLDGFRIHPNYVLDFIDRAIGVYESNRKSAFWRMFNPFFYPGLVLDTISSLPFIVLGKLGFDRYKAETSVIGRLIKGVLYLITVIAAFLTILQRLDFLEPVKQFVHELLGYNKAN